MSRAPFVLLLTLPLCVWPTSFAKSVFQNKQTNKQLPAKQRAFRNVLTYCPRYAVAIYFSVLAVWHTIRLSVYCSAILRSRPCICFLTQFPNYSGISELPRVGALLLSHVGQEKLHRKDDDGQSPNKYRHNPQLFIDRCHQNHC